MTEEFWGKMPLLVKFNEKSQISISSGKWNVSCTNPVSNKFSATIYPLVIWCSSAYRESAIFYSTLTHSLMNIQNQARCISDSHSGYHTMLVRWLYTMCEPDRNVPVFFPHTLFVHASLLYRSEKGFKIIREMQQNNSVLVNCYRNQIKPNWPDGHRHFSPGNV